MHPDMKKDSEHTDDSINVGQRLRRLRSLKGISLKHLAEQTGMSYSYLSGLENGKHSITLTNLQRLSRFFAVDLVTFLSSKPTCVKVFDVESDQGLVTDEGVRIDIVSNCEFRHLQVSVFHIPHPDRSERHVHQHNIGNELIFAVSGKVNVMIDEKVYELSAGQGIVFNSDVEHVIYEAGEPTTLLLISSPPYGND